MSGREGWWEKRKGGNDGGRDEERERSAKCDVPFQQIPKGAMAFVLPFPHHLQNKHNPNSTKTVTPRLHASLILDDPNKVL